MNDDNVVEDEQRTCPDCAAAWVLPGGQREWFLSQHLNLPKRCPECRKARRAAKDGGYVEQSPRADPGPWR
jgi:glutaredoxin